MFLFLLRTKKQADTRRDDREPQFTPSFLAGAIRTGQRRSGLCWACPFGLGFVPGDADLCTLLPGFGESVNGGGGEVQRMPIPSWGPDVYIAFQEPRPSFSSAVLFAGVPEYYYNNNSNTNRRRAFSYVFF